MVYRYWIMSASLVVAIFAAALGWRRWRRGQLSTVTFVGPGLLLLACASFGLATVFHGARDLLDLLGVVLSFGGITMHGVGSRSAHDRGV